MRLLFVTLCFMLLAGCESSTTTSADRGRPKNDLLGGSPHAAAIRLVMETCSDEIDAVDLATTGTSNLDNAPWWFDTDVREFAVTRPVSPGLVDTTHSFDVEYRIKGNSVASWHVNTRTGTVQPLHALKLTQPSSQPSTSSTLPAPTLTAASRPALSREAQAYLEALHRIQNTNGKWVTSPPAAPPNVMLELERGGYLNGIAIDTPLIPADD